MDSLFSSYEYTALVTILAIIINLFFMFRTGLNRLKFKIDAPKTVGNETWERYFRVHSNTVEQMVMFMPALWLAAFYSSDKLAAGIGAVWLVGRLIYSFNYVSNPKSRAPGMLMTFGATAVLGGIALYHIISGMM